MRNIFVFLLLLAAGYLLYTHQDLWRRHSIDASREPYALKALSRGVVNGPFNTEIAVVNGNKWRLEIKNGRKILVVVCDGSQAISNAPPGFPFENLDPRPSMNWAIATAAQYAASPSSPNTTEICDGISCWKTTATFQDRTMELWVGQGTKFPVCVICTVDGQYSENHYARIPINFNDPNTSEFFDTAHTEPIFSGYLMR